MFFATALVKMVGHFDNVANMGEENKPHLVLLRIEGPILSGETYLKSIERISKGDNCKGILLRMDSPGGAVGASQEVYSALKALKVKKHIPIVVSYGNIAASGGYYISLAGDKIFSNRGTLTGSIGVIFQFPEASELMKKIGVNLTTVKSGALKDVGNYARKSTPDELSYLQSVIDNTYEQFVGDVLANRKIKRAELLKVADGRVLTGLQAYAVGLVDTLGGLSEAKQYLETQTQLGADASYIQEPPAKNWVENLTENAKSPLSLLAEKAAPILGQGSFFMWR